MRFAGDRTCRDQCPATDGGFFPVSVWLQSPRNAAYKQIGINLFVGLWSGPTAEQLRALAAQWLSAGPTRPVYLNLGQGVVNKT